MPRSPKRTPAPTPAEGSLRVHGHAPGAAVEQPGACAACGAVLAPGMTRCGVHNGGDAATPEGYKRELEASRARKAANPEGDPLVRARALYEGVRDESERRRKGGRPSIRQP